MIKVNTGLEIHIQRDVSLRAHEVVFLDIRGREDFGGKVYVPDKWLRTRGLSLGGSGMIYHTLMTIFAAFWTKTTRQAGLMYTRYPKQLIEGIDIA